MRSTVVTKDGAPPKRWRWQLLRNCCAAGLMIVSMSGCAVTRSVLITEDGARLSNWSISTAGARVEGRDLAQEYRVDSAGTWRAATGERVGLVEADADAVSAIAEGVLRGLAGWRGIPPF